ncbi:MAG: HAMP domain-containing sensor histidine kinase [Pseudomonadota bacterium]
MATSSRPKAEIGGGSILLRLLLMAAVWCVATIFVAAVALIFLFRTHVTAQIEEELTSQVIQLASLTEPDGAGSYRLRGQMADPRYGRPLSGWVWQVHRDGQVILQSASLGPLGAGRNALPSPVGAVGSLDSPSGRALSGLARTITPRFSQERLTFVVARPSDGFDAAVAQFRNIVLAVLALFGLGQVATAAWLVRTGLKPLTDLRNWVADVRRGEAHAASVAWPREIRPIAQEIEELESHVDRLVARARGQAADLAHAIKTPLTVLRQIGESAEGPDAEQLCRQNARIGAALDRHLARVRVNGRGKTRVNVGAVVEDLKLALDKTLDLRDIALRLELAENTVVSCDENDLYEIVGNLMDNASKWAAGEILVSTASRNGRVTITVEEDGPGIGPEEVASLLKRGHRADQRQAGHGLGLSIVSELVELYAGTLSIEPSIKGGARMTVALPAAGRED